MRLILVALSFCVSLPAFAQTGTSSVSTGGDQRERLLLLQSRLDAFETDMQRAEARVAGLRTSAVEGRVARTTVLIVHKNEVEGSFDLVKARYLLDGAVLLDRDNRDGKLADATVLQLFDGGLDPGEHTIEFELNFRGKAVGPFTYLEGYEFRVRSRVPKKFNVVEGQSNRIDVVATQKDDVTIEPQARLTVRIDTSYDQSKLTVPAETAPPPAKKAPETPDIQ